MDVKTTTAQKIAALNVQIAFIQAADARARADARLDRGEGEGRR